jgi:hypothetical protein
MTPVTILVVVVVTVPTVYYHSRNREPVDYSGTLAEATATYSVSYDSGDGLSNSSTFTRKIIESGVGEDSQICFHVVTMYDPYPYRKVHSFIGSVKVKMGGEEVWRNQADLRVVKKAQMQTDLPIVNTLDTTVTYSRYSGYPGWPYHLGDDWTYEAFYQPETSLQRPWTDTFQAKVVADNAVVEVAGKEYECFEVVHTLIDTTNSIPTGSGIGGTISEYWCKDGKSIGPIKVEDSFNFIGTETQTMIGDIPLLRF